MQSLTIVFLGTSSGTPSRERNVASVAMVLDGTVLLFDCGEATQHQLLRAPVKSGAIEAIFISHLHGDHIYGLPGLLATLSMNNRDRPLTLVGPDGLREYVECMLATSNHHPIFPIDVVAPPYRGEGFTVIAAPLEHSIPALGYCVIEDDRPGRFDPEKAHALGFAPQEFSALVRDGDARVTGPVRRGRRVAICTDTRPCDAAVELARDAEVLIHESTYGEEMRVEADERMHSTAAGAARVALAAGAKQLILTHFSTRYRDVTPLVDEARAVFANSVEATDLAMFAVPPS